MDRVAVFADVQNVYYTVREQYNCHFDYGSFLREVTAGRKLVKAIAYAVDKGDRKQAQFQQILKRLGFEVKLTPYIQRADGSAKGDWDVGLQSTCWNTQIAWISLFSRRATETTLWRLTN